MQTFTVILWSIIKATEIMLMLRALLSWFPISESFAEILAAVTEPIIAPVRILFDKLGIDPPIPIDFPFIITFIIISTLEAFLFL